MPYKDAAKRKNHQNEYRARIRELVLDKYGRVCQWCGATTELELDHVFPLVRVDRHNKAPSEWIDALVFPEKYFQILCHTCNMKKRGIENASY